MKMRSVLLILSIFLSNGVVSSGSGWQPQDFSSFEQIYQKQHGEVKTNNFTSIQNESNSRSSQVSNFNAQVQGSVATKEHLFYIKATPIYTDGDTFTVLGDWSAKLPARKSVLLDLGVDGVKFNTVANSIFARGITTVTLTTPNLTANINRVAIFAAGEGLGLWGNGGIISDDFGTPNQVTLQAALEFIGPLERDLYLYPGEWIFTSNFTSPANVTLKVVRGAVLKRSRGNHFTVYGGFEAGLYKCIDDNSPGLDWLQFASGGGVGALYAVWWGAVPDDMSDSTAALQASLNAGSNSRITVKLINGKADYKAKGLIVGSHTKLIGEGRPTIKLANGKSTLLANRDRVGGNSEIAISDVIFDLDHQNVVGNSGVYFKKVSKLRLDYVCVKNHRNDNVHGRDSGLKLENCTDGETNNVEVAYCDYEGFFIHKSERITINDSDCHHNGNSGIGTSQGEHIYINNPKSRYNGSNKSSQISLNSKKSKIVGGMVIGGPNSYIGIQLGHNYPGGDASDSSVLGTQVVDCRYGGITVTNGKRVKLIDVTVDMKDEKIEAISKLVQAGISFSTGGDTEGGVVIGCSVYKQRYGMYVWGNGKRILYCNIDDTLDSGIQFNESNNSRAEGNRLTNIATTTKAHGLIFTARSGTYSGNSAVKNYIRGGAAIVNYIYESNHYVGTRFENNDIPKGASTTRKNPKTW